MLLYTIDWGKTGAKSVLRQAPIFPGIKQRADILKHWRVEGCDIPKKKLSHKGLVEQITCKIFLQEIIDAYIE